MTRIVIIPPAPRVREAADRVTEAAIAAGPEYSGWTLEDIIADVLGERDADLFESVAIVMRNEGASNRAP